MVEVTSWIYALKLPKHTKVLKVAMLESNALGP